MSTNVIILQTGQLSRKHPQGLRLVSQIWTRVRRLCHKGNVPCDNILGTHAKISIENTLATLLFANQFQVKG